MSQEKAELVYRAQDAFNRRDIDAFLALCDHDVEFIPRLVELEGGGPYRGHDGVRSWWENLLGVSPDLSLEIDEVRDLADVTVTRVAFAAMACRATRPWSRRNGTSRSGAARRPSGGAFSWARPRPSKPPGCGSSPGRPDA